jgi:hypothetical protein
MPVPPAAGGLVVMGHGQDKLLVAWPADDLEADGQAVAVVAARQVDVRTSWPRCARSCCGPHAWVELRTDLGDRCRPCRETESNPRVAHGGLNPVQKATISVECAHSSLPEKQILTRRRGVEVVTTVPVGLGVSRFEKVLFPQSLSVLTSALLHALVRTKRRPRGTTTATCSGWPPVRGRFVPALSGAQLDFCRLTDPGPAVADLESSAWCAAGDVSLSGTLGADLLTVE